jgi:hypothetical protein
VDGDITDLIQALGRVNHPTTLQQHIVLHG